MSFDWFQKFDHIAKEMNEIRTSPSAEVGYDVLTDALTWSDEFPPHFASRINEFECIKILQRYRTSVLTGRPEESLKTYWDYALRLFPNWAGFSEDRFRPTESLLKFYQRACARDMRMLEAVFKPDLKKS